MPAKIIDFRAATQKRDSAISKDLWNQLGLMNIASRKVGASGQQILPPGLKARLLRERLMRLR